MFLFAAIPFVFVLVYPSFIMFVVAAGIAACVDAMFWLREWYFRPNRIRIDEPGLILFFRHRRPRIVNWENVAGLEAYGGDALTIGDRLETAGILILARSERFPRAFPATLGIIEAIRDAKPGRFAAPPRVEDSTRDKRRRVVIIIMIVFALIESAFLILFVVTDDPFMIFAQLVAVIAWVAAIAYGVRLFRRKERSDG